MSTFAADSPIQWDSLCSDLDCAEQSILDDALAIERLWVTYPTPPSSEPDHGPSMEDQAEPTVSISTAFSPGLMDGASAPDVIATSSDGVYFYVHSNRLLAASTNEFAGHLLCNPVTSFAVSEPAAVLNLVLHAVYGIPCHQYTPSFAELDAATTALSGFGIASTPALAPEAPIGQALRALAPHHPLDIYTLAASHDAYALAQAASVHLLGFPLCTITDETTERLGGLYTKKLFFLHLGRIEALKCLLSTPPALHAPTVECGLEKQKGLTRAWALAAAYVSWEAKADAPLSTICSAFSSLRANLTCLECQSALTDRLKDLNSFWSSVKSTV